MKTPAAFHSVLLAAFVALSIGAAGVTGCGGDGDSSQSESVTTTADSSSDASSGGSDALGEGASFDEVLACLQDAGLDAKDQSSNTSGDTIGIDYSGGRTVISFEESAADAEATASVAESYGEVLTAGNVVASLDTSPEASADADAVESCITG
jgi:hypothetical protein